MRATRITATYVGSNIVDQALVPATRKINMQTSSLASGADLSGFVSASCLTINIYSSTETHRRPLYLIKRHGN